MSSFESRPTVSVVMVTYNQADIIGDAISGVVNQSTDFSVELIIANDASTDNTLTVCKQWQTRYPYVIRIINNPVNVGLRQNYLNAIRECKGKYIAMCDADDYWCSRHKLSRQVSYMESHDRCAVTFHRVINLYIGSKRRTMSLSNGHQQTDTSILELSRSNFITNLSVMYRADVMADAGYPDWIVQVPSPDYILHMMFAAHGSIHYFPQAMGVYRKHAEGAWSLAGADKQTEMSITEREYLLRYFSGNRAVTQGLLESCTAILVGAIARHKVSRSGHEGSFVMKLKELRPDLTDEDVDRLVMSRVKSGNRPALKLHSMLSGVRKFLSGLVPVPRPC